MKNKKIKLAVGLFFAGFSAGNTIGLIVNIIISYCIGKGKYIAVMPQLSSHFENEINAVTAQSLIFGIIGIVFAEGSFIFTIDCLTFLKQCIIHFSVTAIFYIPFIYLCYAPVKFINVFVMLCNIVFTYSLTWYLRYKQDKRSVEQINRKIEEARQNDGYKNQRSDQEI